LTKDDKEPQLMTDVIHPGKSRKKENYGVGEKRLPKKIRKK